MNPTDDEIIDDDTAKGDDEIDLEGDDKGDLFGTTGNPAGWGDATDSGRDDDN